jgi:hypothetical protein
LLILENAGPPLSGERLDASSKEKHTKVTAQWSRKNINLKFVTKIFKKSLYFFKSPAGRQSGGGGGVHVSGF